LSRSPGSWSALALAAVALGSGVGFADPPAKPADPDEELLEFLGTVDSATDANTQPDDQSWIDYLSQTDIDRAALGGAAPGTAAKKADAPGHSGAKGPSAPGAQGADAKPGAPKVKSDDQ
jgi:hypothetical protein